MNQPIIIAFPGNTSLAGQLAAKTGYAMGSFGMRHFPDGESYIRVISDVKKKEIILVCTLDRPDEKFLRLLFLSKTLKDLGANKITLVSPYLAYMRQDKLFNPGEALTSEYFASFISLFIDELVTIDPHLHRRKSLEEIYSIPCYSLQSAPLISKYIINNIKNPLLIGPDSESEQWVKDVAEKAGVPYLVLEKERLGDKSVKVSIRGIAGYSGFTPVLLDDIISTAQTMIETVKHLQQAGMQQAVCIGVHAVFAENAYKELSAMGVKIVTCDTVPHESNGIEVVNLVTGILLRRT